MATVDRQVITTVEKNVFTKYEYKNIQFQVGQVLDDN
jgi:hypothetical protein